MRLLFYSLLALLPFMGLSLNAANACECPHAERTTAEIEAVPCCQGAPMDCCVQHNRDPEPEQSLLGVVPALDSFQLTLVAVATVAEDRAILRPEAGLFAQRARPPPLPSSEHRCRLQSWLV